MCGLYEGDCQLIMSFGAVWGGISGLLEIADRRLSALGAQIDLAQFEPALGVHGIEDGCLLEGHGGLGRAAAFEQLLPQEIKCLDLAWIGLASPVQMVNGQAPQTLRCGQSPARKQDAPTLSFELRCAGDLIRRIGFSLLVEQCPSQ